MRLPFDSSRPGAWLSAAAHLALLAAGIFAFTSETLPDAEEGIPVEVVTDNQLSQITRGETNAAEVKPDVKPRADRVAETVQQKDPGEAKVDAPTPPKRPAEVKVADREVEPAPTPPARVEIDKPDPPPMPPSRPEPSRAEPSRPEPSRAEQEKKEKAEKVAADKKAADKKAADEQRAEEIAERKEAEEEARIARQKADQAKLEAKAKADQEAKRVAAAKVEADRKAKEALDARLKEMEAKEEADAKAKAAEQRRKVAEAARRKEAAEAKARRQAELADKFNPGDITKVLSSNAPSRSTGATGREVQKTASLGTATGTAQRLNPSQRDQIAGLIREQLIRCWQPPIAVQGAAKPPTATIRLALAQDGSLSAEPSVMNHSSDPLFRPVADSALRATRRCAPIRIPAQFAPFYTDWKDLVVDFDPREMG